MRGHVRDRLGTCQGHVRDIEHVGDTAQGDIGHRKHRGYVGDSGWGHRDMSGTWDMLATQDGVSGTRGRAENMSEIKTG